MSLATFWHSPVILVSKRSSESLPPTQSILSSPNDTLPRWEQHPWRRSRPGDGGLDQEWIRIHLP